jgi:hypothetical protein
VRTEVRDAILVRMEGDSVLKILKVLDDISMKN